MSCRHTKQEESEEDGEMRLFENFKSHLNPLPIDKILLGNTNIRKVVDINLKPAFPVRSIREFRKISARSLL